MVKNGENSNFQPYRESVYEGFVHWFALPSSERAKTGAETMAQFAKRHDVHPNTLTRWRQASGFKEKVFGLRRNWGDDLTPYVFDGWKLACMKGDAKAIELWLAYFLDFNKNKVAPKQLEVTENDIRSLINELPIEEQKKFYGYLTELHDKVRSHRRLWAEKEQRLREEEGKENSSTFPMY